MFETEDLVLRKNEKNFVLCLLEVSRRASRFGMSAPTLIQMEEEIEEEIREEMDLPPEDTPLPKPQRKPCDFKNLDQMVKGWGHCKPLAGTGGLSSLILIILSRRELQEDLSGGLSQCEGRFSVICNLLWNLSGRKVLPECERFLFLAHGYLKPSRVSRSSAPLFPAGQTFWWLVALTGVRR